MSVEDIVSLSKDSITRFNCVLACYLISFSSRFNSVIRSSSVLACYLISFSSRFNSVIRSSSVLACYLVSFSSRFNSVIRSFIALIQNSFFEINCCRKQTYDISVCLSSFLLDFRPSKNVRQFGRTLPSARTIQ